MSTSVRLRLTPKDVRACGRVAIWAAQLDMLMELTLWHVLNLSPSQGRKTTVRMTSKLKRALLTAVGGRADIDPSERVNLMAILDRVEPVMEDRNTIVHGHWYDDGTSRVAKFDETGKMTFDGALTASDINPVADAAKALVGELTDWLLRHDGDALHKAFTRRPTGIRHTLQTK
jgi:hypothetical protein